MEFNDEQKQLTKLKDHFKQELAGLRIGRASPSLVEKIKILYYGVPTPLTQVASITASDTKTLLIQPWDKTLIKEIEKSIQTSDLGIQPIATGDSIRLIIPPLTEERRRELTKLVIEKLEAARIAVRRIREATMKKIKEDEESGKTSEDLSQKMQKQWQELIDETMEQLAAIKKEKDEELMRF